MASRVGETGGPARGGSVAVAAQEILQSIVELDADKYI
jgi:hypothetical protein